MRSSPSSSCFTLLHGISAKPFSKPGLGVPPFLLRQASASYVIDVLIAVIDSEISFVRLRREKDRIESEKGEEKEKERDGSIRKEQVREFYTRVSLFAISSSFLDSSDGWTFIVTAISFVRSFVRSLRETKRERSSRSDQETRRTTRDWKQKKKNAAGSWPVRRTGRFEETQKVEGRRQGREGV